MKRRNKLVLIFCMAVGSAPTVHAADPLSWARSKAQVGVQKVSKALPQWPKEVVRVVKKKYFDKQLLNEKEQQVLKRLQIGTVAAIIAALTAGTAYVVSREQEEAPLEITPSTGVKATNVGDVLSKWKVVLGQDDSPPALFIKAVTNGAGWMVNGLYDLVPKNALQAGLEIATDRVKSSPAIYIPIKETLQKALASFNESQFRKNMRFIYAAMTGLLDEVKQNICVDRIKPSKNAMAEALEQLKKKTGEMFESIKGFIQNPKCFLGR